MTGKRKSNKGMEPMGRVKKIHFVGIGGAGMGGIAEVLWNLGYAVTGSDLHENAMTQRLVNLGVTVYTQHRAEYAVDRDVVVVSSAVNTDNPEICAALQANIPVIPRAEMLAELMRFRFGIAVAGTHGKTTTTSILASLLAEGGLDPTFVIGGKLNSVDANARLGQGQYLVAEADESDASFLHLQPVMAVVTNIEADHLQAYDDDFEKLQAAFLEFLHHLPFYGLAVLCVDDPIVQELANKVEKPVLRYGTHKNAEVRAKRITHQGMQTRFTISLPDKQDWLRVTLNLPGKHNVLNALAAVAIARELGVKGKAIEKALGEFQGISRRFQRYGVIEIPQGPIELVDDYGHHPSEIAATLESVRQCWPERRIVVVFQPHRYTRTRDLFEDFVRVLSEVDVLLLMDIYAAGEAPIRGADARTLARALRNRGKVDPVFVANKQDLFEALPGQLLRDDVLLTLGAGDVGRIAVELPDFLHSLNASDQTAIGVAQ